MSIHILLVEDDRNTRRALAYQLQYAGYRVTQAPDGITALDLMEQEVFDVVLTDIVLGDIDGIEVLHTARVQSYHPAVVLLTGHATIETSLAALREGAVDYLMKPCTPDQLLAAMDKAARRHKDERNMRQATALLKEVYDQTDALSSSQTSASQDHDPPQAKQGTRALLYVGALSIGPTRHSVTLSEKAVQLTPIEFELLRFLAEKPGEVRLFRDIVRHTHPLDTDDAEAQMLVKQHIRNLRKKLGGAYLVNQRGIGYKLVDPEIDELP
jgi:DNA-binding response OmpR family regulator